jgi:hypothetical protein
MLVALVWWAMICNEVLVHHIIPIIGIQIIGLLTYNYFEYELPLSRLDAAKAGLVELEVDVKRAQLDLGLTEGLAARSLASQADLDRDELSVAAVSAPFAGVVIAKAAQPGEMISPVSAGEGQPGGR